MGTHEMTPNETPGVAAPGVSIPVFILHFMLLSVI